MVLNSIVSAGLATVSVGVVALPVLAAPETNLETLNTVAPVSLEAEFLALEGDEPTVDPNQFAAIANPTGEEVRVTIPLTAQRPFENSDGRRTSSKFSYIGIGGALGLSDDGDTELGDGGFALMSKTGFSENISLHNLSVLGSDPVTSIALTADFPIRNGNEPDSAIAAVPFAGAGIAISNLFQDDSEAAFLLTAGVDVPLAYRWTATGRVAVGFFDDTEAALAIGVGYTFTGFFK